MSQSRNSRTVHSQRRAPMFDEDGYYIHPSLREPVYSEDEEPKGHSYDYMGSRDKYAYHEGFQDRRGQEVSRYYEWDRDDYYARTTYYDSPEAPRGYRQKYPTQKSAQDFHTPPTHATRPSYQGYDTRDYHEQTKAYGKPSRYEQQSSRLDERDCYKDARSHKGKNSYDRLNPYEQEMRYMHDDYTTPYRTRTWKDEGGYYEPKCYKEVSHEVTGHSRPVQSSIEVTPPSYFDEKHYTNERAAKTEHCQAKTKSLGLTPVQLEEKNGSSSKSESESEEDEEARWEKTKRNIDLLLVGLESLNKELKAGKPHPQEHKNKLTQAKEKPKQWEGLLPTPSLAPLLSKLPNTREKPKGSSKGVTIPRPVPRTKIVSQASKPPKVVKSKPLKEKKKSISEKFDSPQTPSYKEVLLPAIGTKATSPEHKYTTPYVRPAKEPKGKAGEQPVLVPKGGGSSHPTSATPKPKAIPPMAEPKGHELQAQDHVQPPKSTAIQQTTTQSKNEEGWAVVVMAKKRQFHREIKKPTKEPEPFPYVSIEKTVLHKSSELHIGCKSEIGEDQEEGVPPMVSREEGDQIHKLFNTSPIRMQALELEGPNFPPVQPSVTSMPRGPISLKGEESFKLSAFQLRLLQPFGNGLKNEASKRVIESKNEEPRSLAWLHQTRSIFKQPDANTSLDLTDPSISELRSGSLVLGDQLVESSRSALHVRHMPRAKQEPMMKPAYRFHVGKSRSRPRTIAWMRRLPKRPNSSLGQHRHKMFLRVYDPCPKQRAKLYNISWRKREPNDGCLSFEVRIKWGKPGRISSWESVRYVGSTSNLWEISKAIFQEPNIARAWGQARSKGGGSVTSLPRPSPRATVSVAEDSHQARNMGKSAEEGSAKRSEPCRETCLEPRRANSTGCDREVTTKEGRLALPEWDQTLRIPPSLVQPTEHDQAIHAELGRAESAEHSRAMPKEPGQALPSIARLTIWVLSTAMTLISHAATIIKGLTMPGKPKRSAVQAENDQTHSRRHYSTQRVSTDSGEKITQSEPRRKTEPYQVRAKGPRPP